MRHSNTWEVLPKCWTNIRGFVLTITLPVFLTPHPSPPSFSSLVLLQAAHWKTAVSSMVLHFGKLLHFERRGSAGHHSHPLEAPNHLTFGVSWLSHFESPPNQRGLTLLLLVDSKTNGRVSTFNVPLCVGYSYWNINSLTPGWTNRITSSPLLVLDNGVPCTKPYDRQSPELGVTDPRYQVDSPGNQTRHLMLKTQKTPENGTQQGFLYDGNALLVLIK